MTMLVCGWFVAMSAVATGCADASDGTGRGVETTETSGRASGLTQQVSFAQVEMDLPENWGVYATGNSAVVGISRGRRL